MLNRFLASGGWKLIFQWLGDAINNGNNPFIKEILQLLILCPIRIDFLRESNAPRIVKGLSKDSEDRGNLISVEHVLPEKRCFSKSSINYR